MMKSFLALMAIAALAAPAGCDKKEEPATVHVTVANEMAAMTRLRAVAHAEMLYQAESGGEYATLAQLIDKGLVNDPASGKFTGYRFEVKVWPDGFAATATPEKFGITGKRSFYIDQTRQMRGADKGGAAATASDPPVS